MIQDWLLKPSKDHLPTPKRDTIIVLTGLCCDKDWLNTSTMARNLSDIHKILVSLFSFDWWFIYWEGDIIQGSQAIYPKLLRQKSYLQKICNCEVGYDKYLGNGMIHSAMWVEKKMTITEVVKDSLLEEAEFEPEVWERVEMKWTERSR